jgi:hypothetical protein
MMSEREEPMMCTDCGHEDTIHGTIPASSTGPEEPVCHGKTKAGHSCGCDGPYFQCAGCNESVRYDKLDDLMCEPCLSEDEAEQDRLNAIFEAN